MDYSFSLYWNGELVAHGMATAPVAYDLATSHLRDNFAGPVHQAATATHTALGLLNVIRDLPRLGAKTLEYSDETGAARATITRVR